jgi:uncharacterized membrane protein YphA (DoxX/SURF4 family)
MIRFIDAFSRYFIGILFIFSGLIKLNDPIGTEIKMEEYFEVFAQNFHSAFLYLKPISLEIGLAMIVLEIVLGVAILVYYRMNVTATVTLILLIFFTFLTGYSHFTNAVTDCGCFGDAIKLTPAIKYTLEQALDFIEDDELVEVTPKEIRLRKKFLTESDRKRASRAA